MCLPCSYILLFLAFFLSLVQIHLISQSLASAQSTSRAEIGLGDALDGDIALCRLLRRPGTL
jgi:hypothetical protein